MKYYVKSWAEGHSSYEVAGLREARKLCKAVSMEGRGNEAYISKMGPRGEVIVENYRFGDRY